MFHVPKENTNSLLLIYAFPTVLDSKAHLNVSAGSYDSHCLISLHFTENVSICNRIAIAAKHLWVFYISPIRFYFGSVDAPLIFGVIFAFVVLFFQRQTFCILNFRKCFH